MPEPEVGDLKTAMWEKRPHFLLCRKHEEQSVGWNEMALRPLGMNLRLTFCIRFSLFVVSKA